LNNLIERLDRSKSKKSITKLILQRRASLTEEYFNVVNQFFGFLNAYVIARHYKDYKFYFPIYLDSRGRLYYKCTGSNFGLQTGDLSKALINLKGNRYNKEIKLNGKVDSSNKKFQAFANSISKDEDPFLFTCIKEGFYPTTISNDASCSGTSILSGMIGNRRGLIMTNVVREKNAEIRGKQCVYMYFSKLLETH